MIVKWGNLFSFVFSTWNSWDFGPSLALSPSMWLYFLISLIIFDIIKLWEWQTFMEKCLWLSAGSFSYVASILACQLPFVVEFRYFRVSILWMQFWNFPNAIVIKNSCESLPHWIGTWEYLLEYQKHRQINPTKLEKKVKVFVNFEFRAESEHKINFNS